MGVRFEIPPETGDEQSNPLKIINSRLLSFLERLARFPKLTFCFLQKRNDVEKDQH
jgi:hypothetical protein